MRPISKLCAVRKPWEAAVPVGQANRQWANWCGRRQALTMSRIARGFPPTRPLARRIACPISMGHYQRSLVLAGELGASISDVRRSIKRLTAPGGWFTIEKGGERRRANVYCASFEKVTAWAPDAPFKRTF